MQAPLRPPPCPGTPCRPCPPPHDGWASGFCFGNRRVKDFVVFPQQRELELQRQRGEHKIRQLQRMVQALQAKEAAGQAPEAERLQEERLGLEKVRQQLLCAAGLLTSFVSRTVDR